MDMASVSEWPAPERPRERLLARGPAELTDAELLALVVGASCRGSGGAVETCRHLLARFEGLPGLGRSQPGELMQTRGIGTARACALTASLELARRLEGAASLRGDPIGCAEDVVRRLRPRLAGVHQETFWVLALDAKHRLLATRQVAQGSVTSVEVHPREVFQGPVRESAAAVIVAHNHPSGDPEPSREDERLTLRLLQAGEILGIPLLDHVIVAGRSFVSLAARGLLMPPPLFPVMARRSRPPPARNRRARRKSG